MTRLHAVLAVVFAVAVAAPAVAADYPKPQEGDWIAKDFKFHNGEVMPELKLHYTTIGDPKNPAVLMLHGSSGSGATLLTPGFAGELFGAGQPLDAEKYYIILPDGLGHGKSTKPSDGLKAKFPELRLCRHGRCALPAADRGDGRQAPAPGDGQLDGRHARLAVGRECIPTFMDALVPMASQPTPMSARNWMMRRLIIDSVKNDPDWNGGNYTTQPKGVKAATVFFGIATSGGTLAYAKLAPTREAADKMLDERLAAPFTADANDFLYQWAASGDYDPTALLPRITAKLLLINAADDERNPPETGLTEKAMKQVGNGSLYLIPASDDTRGHGTTGNARFYTKQLAEFLLNLPAAVR